MLCMNKIALAFNSFTSAFNLEHSSGFSGVPRTLATSVLSAVCFSVVMAFVTAQFVKNRAWFLWALSSASILQCAGFIASVVHTHDGTNHIAFLASFATITFAPMLLSIAVFSTFDRLRQTVMPESAKRSRNMWTYVVQRLGSFILVPCLVPIAMFACGIFNISKFLSPLPIEDRSAAFMRLLNYELGISQLEKAHASQAVICIAFGIFTNIFTTQSTSWKAEALSIRNKNWRELLHTINVVNSLVCLRACYKVYECQEISASRMALGDGGVLFWFLDVLPMLAALVVFSAVKPTSYLPESSGRIMLDPEAPYVNEKVLPDYSGTQF